MPINELFQIIIDRTYYDNALVTGYQVSIYNDEWEDYEVIRLNVNLDEPYSLCIDQFDLSIEATDFILDHYASMTEFTNQLTQYIQRLLIDLTISNDQEEQNGNKKVKVT